ncbi:MAG: hypothetical protein HXX09_11630 [Bacteroidetes bacterium]|nr:hypothetical protein [Bacteroidota bacterium]
MKKIFIVLFITYSSITVYAQNTKNKVSKDSVIVDSKVEFFIYDGPYGEKENIKVPAIKFILTVKNKGTNPIPDLGVTNRSEYVNLFINDSLNNPVSMYNGTEAIGTHLIKKNGSDTYTWWVFENEGYGKIFTVKWQYMNLFSKKIKVNVTKKTIE